MLIKNGNRWQVTAFHNASHGCMRVTARLRGVGFLALICIDGLNWAIWAGRCEAGVRDGDVAVGVNAGQDRKCGA